MDMKWKNPLVCVPSSLATSLLCVYFEDFQFCFRSIIVAAALLRFEFSLRVERAWELFEHLSLSFDGQGDDIMTSTVLKKSGKHPVRICIPKLETITQPLMSRSSDQQPKEKREGTYTRFPSPSFAELTPKQKEFRREIAEHFLRTLYLDASTAPASPPHLVLCWALVDTAASLFRRRLPLKKEFTVPLSQQLKAVQASISPDVSRESYQFVQNVSALHFERVHHTAFKQAIKDKKSDVFASSYAMSIAKEARISCTQHVPPPTQSEIEKLILDDASQLLSSRSSSLKSFLHPSNAFLQETISLVGMTENPPAVWRFKFKAPVPQLTKPNQSHFFMDSQAMIFAVDSLSSLASILIAHPTLESAITGKRKASGAMRRKTVTMSEDRYDDASYHFDSDQDAEENQNDESDEEAAVARALIQMRLQEEEREKIRKEKLIEKKKTEKLKSKCRLLSSLLDLWKQKVSKYLNERQLLIDQAWTLAINSKVKLPSGERLEALLWKLRESKRKKDEKQRRRDVDGDATPPVSEDENDAGLSRSIDDSLIECRKEIERLRASILRLCPGFGSPNSKGANLDVPSSSQKIFSGLSSSEEEKLMVVEFVPIDESRGETQDSALAKWASRFPPQSSPVESRSEGVEKSAAKASTNQISLCLNNAHLSFFTLPCIKQSYFKVRQSLLTQTNAEENQSQLQRDCPEKEEDDLVVKKRSKKRKVSCTTTGDVSDFRPAPSPYDPQPTANVARPHHTNSQNPYDRKPYALPGNNTLYTNSDYSKSFQAEHTHEVPKNLPFQASVSSNPQSEVSGTERKTPYHSSSSSTVASTIVSTNHSKLNSFEANLNRTPKETLNVGETEKKTGNVMSNPYDRPSNRILIPSPPPNRNSTAESKENFQKKIEVDQKLQSSSHPKTTSHFSENKINNPLHQNNYHTPSMPSLPKNQANP
eukprot:GDKJ01018951.1.p1 GENE.GDKJ01018951.1~~GDKJ01018951.1.p1  ORF type:complete len:1033 (-),score=221.75 GDKJ01018951.1:186-2993(-)